MKHLLAVAVISISFLFLGAAWLQADTFVVDRFGDSASFTQCNDFLEEDCSLRGAIIRANQWPGHDIIEFDLPVVPPFYLRTIYLSLTGMNEDNCLVGDLDITERVTIVGGGWVEIDASQLGDRVFHIEQDVSGDVVLQGLKIQGGSGVVKGGGFLVGSNSSLVLDRVEVRENSAGSTGGGGAVSPNGRLWIMRSTLVGNQAQSYSALVVEGEAHISASTISGNTCTAPSYSYAIGVTSNATLLWLHHSTIADNDPGPGYTAIKFSGSLTFDVWASIIEGGCWDSDYATMVLSSGGNIESPGDTCGLNPAIDQVNVADPGLWPLAYCGGTTPTLVPEPESPAVDDPLGVLGTCTVDDQRELPRSVDGNGDGVVGCDSGAVERQPDEAELFFDGFESGDTTRW